MAVNWKAYLLSGTKDNSNKTFTLPIIPDARATRVLYNGDILRRVANNPVPTQYSISGGTIFLGEAPGANDDLWALVAEATAVISSSIVEIRPDFHFVVELRNSVGSLKEVFQRDIDDIYWTYFTNGGCGACEIGLSRFFDNYGDIQTDDEVFVYRQLNPQGSPGTPLPAQLPILLGTSLTGARELRYSGKIKQIEPVFDHNESVRLRSVGFRHQLSRIAVPEREYQDMDIGAVVRDIVDTLVLPGSRILRTDVLGLVPDTGQNVTDVFFDAMADEALAGLAELCNAEFGVRGDREVYFMPRSSVVRQTYNVGKEIDFYVSNLDADDVVNRVYLRGADGYRAELNNGAYQTSNQKERILTVPFITSDEDAALWGTAFFAVHGAVQRRGRLVLGATDKWIENPEKRITAADHPLGLLRICGAPRFVNRGEPLPDQLPMLLGETLGTFTDHRFRINSVKYTPEESGLNIEIELGERTSAGERFLSIERKLSELRQLAA